MAKDKIAGPETPANAPAATTPPSARIPRILPLRAAASSRRLLEQVQESILIEVENSQPIQRSFQLIRFRPLLASLREQLFDSLLVLGTHWRVFRCLGIELFLAAVALRLLLRLLLFDRVLDLRQ